MPRRRPRPAATAARAAVIILCNITSEQILWSINMSFLKYDWDYGDGNKSTAFQDSHVFKDTGTYLVNLKATDVTRFCSSTNSEIIKIGSSVNSQSPVAEVIMIYPNPAHDVLHIYNPSLAIGIFSLSDLTGREVSSEEIASSQSIDLGHLAKGTYLYLFKQNELLSTGKIVIE